MKKLFLLLLALLFVLSGCTTVGSSGKDKVKRATEQDSVVRLDIYPKNEKYETVGIFDRTGYRQLNEKQKSLYILMDNAVYNMKEGYIKLGEVDDGDISMAFSALRNDRPEYFWMPISYTMRSIDKEKEVSFTQKNDGWLYTPEERKKYESQIRRELSVFLGTTKRDLSEYERELLAHDKITKDIYYHNVSLKNYEKYIESWNIVGAFVKGKAVCEGYSRAMQVLSFMLGLDCTLVTGVTTEPHMWNLINIDGEWYHLDLTADDDDRGPFHFFFNVTTDYMEQGRTIDSKVSSSSSQLFSEDRYNIFLPECTATAYNYHIYNSLYIAEKSQAESAIVSAICAAVREGRDEIEIGVSKDMGFLSGRDNASEFFRLDKCISVANSELSKSQRVRSYSYGGVSGALGFVIKW